MCIGNKIKSLKILLATAATVPTKHVKKYVTVCALLKELKKKTILGEKTFNFFNKYMYMKNLPIVEDIRKKI